MGRIAATIDAPVTVDFEGGYSEDDDELAGNIARLLDLGVIGINFEDRVVKGSGSLQDCPSGGAHRHHPRDGGGAGREALHQCPIDVFFEHGDDARGRSRGARAAKAYAVAGASGFFVPGLADATLIGRIVEGTPLRSTSWSWTRAA